MYEHFKTDEEAERNGVILDYSDFRVTVARAGGANRKYTKVLERISRPYRRAIQTETLSTEKSQELLQVATAEAVVRNWEVKQGEEWVQGIVDPTDPEKANILPFNRDSVLTVFKALPDLFEDIREQSAKVSLFLLSLREEAAKNL